MQIKFVLQDFWIGLYWKHACLGQQGCGRDWVTTYYLCLIPCFPIIWKRHWREH